MADRKLPYKIGDLVWFNTVAYEIIVAEWTLDGPQYTLRDIASPGTILLRASPACSGWGCRTKVEVARRPKMSDFV